jgi:hypothetical protein
MLMRMQRINSNYPRPYFYYRFYDAKLCLRKLILLLFFSDWTPLHQSAKNGDLEVCRLLLQCNADVEAKTRK